MCVASTSCAHNVRSKHPSRTQWVKQAPLTHTMCVANIPHAHNVRSKHSSGRLLVLSTIVRNITGNKHFFHQVGVAPSHLSLLLGKGQSCWVNLSSSYPRDGSARAGIYSTEGTVLPVVKQHCRSSYDAVTRKNVACPASARRERTRNACA